MMATTMQFPLAQFMWKINQLTKQTKYPKFQNINQICTQGTNIPIVKYFGPALENSNLCNQTAVC